MSLLSRLAVSAARAYGVLSSKNTNVSASYLVVAGGGGGGSSRAAGGGGGGMRTSTATLSTLVTYTVTVGAGGLGGLTGNGQGGATGSNSVLSGTGFTTITSAGGGGGADDLTTSPSQGSGKSGGTGGGGVGGATAPGTGPGGTGNTPSTSPSQGANGGTGFDGTNYGAGGGGGGGASGATGGNGTATTGGAGGAGTASSISGSSVTYAGGGGGGTYNGGTAGAGGSGGGGAGSNVYASAGGVGTVNLGGGGGGGAYVAPSGASAGGNGGSGVVIISYTSATPKFVGGTLTTSGGNQIHTFTSSGTLSPLTPITASYLVVAGGAGGGGRIGGGGGAGGFRTDTTTLYSGATYVVTVGAGGAGGTSGGTRGTSGSNSELSGTGITTITSAGGGGGGTGAGPEAGVSGGSGGGVANNTGTAGSGNTPSTSPSQGNNGGQGNSPNQVSGGGGGAGAVGGDSSGATAGTGGAGTASSITGSSVTYAGGGGGGTNGGTAGAGGTGGGGAGTNNSTTAVAGTTNLGGGGGGGGYIATGGAGGSGTVIISYAGSQAFNGGLVTSSGGNTIHTFNATGALTPLTNNLTNSLRFRASSSGYLSRTPSIAGNTQKWTWSAWIKLGKLSTFGGLFGALNGTDRMYIAYNSSAKWQIFGTNAGTDYVEAVSTGLYRDPSAWYHLVIAVDTTQATASNRLKMYVNGNQETVSFTTNMTLNANTSINKAIATVIGETSVGSDPFDGYLTDVNFIDGQALEPYYFGNNDAYGNWKPILYKGTYGTNGFYLTFSDTSALTTSSNVGLGKDFSNNGNYWATNNISITAGTTYDAMLDVPTNTSATVANYAVLNPLKNGGTAPSGGNLNIVSSADNTICLASIGMSSGKWYWEQVQTAGSIGSVAGIAQDNAGLSTYIGGNANSWGYHPSGLTYTNATSSSYGNTWTTNDIIGVAFDADNGKLYFSKNGTFQNSGNPVTGTNPAYSSLTTTPYFPAFQTNSATTSSINFGQRPFSYTAPSGFVALNTYNLPTPTILQGNKYMDATLYTGNGSTQVIVNNAQFKPDAMWIKTRSAGAYNHHLVDSVRGVTKNLRPNSTGVEDTTTDQVTAINSNGFSLGADTAGPADREVNVSGSTYVGWQWQANQGSTVSNTSGSITSTVSVNTTAGFSVVTYTGNGTNGATIGHSLGVAPKMVIVKSRSSANDWAVYHSSLAANNMVFLNSTGAAQAITFYDNGGVSTTSSTTFTIAQGGVSQNNVNGNTQTYVAYCWAEIAGFSKFGSYTGNGSTDGPFVYLGFRPKFIVLKSATNAGSNWWAEDTSRSTYNAANALLFPNLSNAEYTTAGVETDILSNGFKLRTSNNDGNQSGATFIYMAFAENPFNNSNAR